MPGHISSGSSWLKASGGCKYPLPVSSVGPRQCFLSRADRHTDLRAVWMARVGWKAGICNASEFEAEELWLGFNAIRVLLFPCFRITRPHPWTRQAHCLPSLKGEILNMSCQRREGRGLFLYVILLCYISSFLQNCSPSPPDSHFLWGSDTGVAPGLLHTDW